MPARLMRNALFVRAVPALVLCLVAWIWAPTGPAAQEQEIPVPELPMYGTAPKDSELVETDRARLQAVMDRGLSRQEVFDAAITAGWGAYRVNELGTAMRRFNQAWLLDPDHGKVYWGFAFVVAARDGDLAGAARFLARARRLLPDDPDLMADSGFLMVRMGRLDDAIDLLEEAQAIKPDVPSADRGLAIAYFGKGAYDRALIHAKRAQARGETLPERFLQDLRAKTQ